MDGATGKPVRRPLLNWPVRASERSVDSTLYSFLWLSTLSTSPESVKTPPRKRKTLRMRRLSLSYGRQANLIPLGPERQRGAVLSQEPGTRHAAAVAPLRAKRERPRKTKRPDRVERVTLVVIARKGETVDVVDHARVPVGVCFVRTPFEPLE